MNDKSNKKLNTRIAAPGSKKILTCEGGGILGLISMEILAKIEAALRKARNQQNLVLADYFDFFCGTSAGVSIG